MHMKEIKERLDTLAALVKTSSTVQRIETYAEKHVTLSLKACALIIALFIVALFFTSCQVTRHVNEQWATKLAEKSSRVKAVVENKQQQIDTADEEILNAVEKADAELAAKEKELKALRNRPSSDNSCPRIPARCVR